MIGQLILIQLAPDYMSQAVVGSTMQRNEVRMEAPASSPTSPRLLTPNTSGFPPPGNQGVMEVGSLGEAGKEGQEVGYPRGRELGEIRKNFFAILYTMLQ